MFFIAVMNTFLANLLRRAVVLESKLFPRTLSSTVVELSAKVHASKTHTPESPAMVMMHGVFGNSRNFSALGKRIAAMSPFDVHCLDLRNHGSSPHAADHSNKAMVDDVIHYITNHIQPSSCILLGHSMGGRVAFDSVFHCPALFSAVIVEDSSPFASNRNTILTSNDLNSPFVAVQILKGIELESFRGESLTSVRKTLTESLSTKVPSVAVQSFLLTNLIQRGDEFHWRCNVDAIADYLDSYRHSSKQESTVQSYAGAISQKIDVPFLCIRGSNSNYVSDDDIEQIRQLFSDVSVATLDTGHWVHAEKPHDFLEAIVNFLTEKQLLYDSLLRAFPRK